MLALAFVLLIGFALVAEGSIPHPQGLIYAAMAFSVMVEALTSSVERRKRRAREAARRAARRREHARSPTRHRLATSLTGLKAPEPACYAPPCDARSRTRLSREATAA